LPVPRKSSLLKHRRLGHARPPKPADAEQQDAEDAKALTRYLSAVGLEVGPDRLSDLLVLLAAIMVEVGGRLSLAIEMVLSEPVRTPAAALVASVQTALTAQAPALHADIDSRDTSSFKVSGQLTSNVRRDLIRLHGDLIRCCRIEAVASRPLCGVLLMSWTFTGGQK